MAKTKQSNNFEDMLKSVLVSEEKKDKPQLVKKKKIVKEAASGGGPSSTSVSRGTRGNMPPFSTYTDQMQNRGSVDMMDIDAAQDKEAPPRSPYPLETIIDHIGSSYQSLGHAEELIHISFKNPILSETQLKELKSIQSRLKSALGNIKASVDAVRKIVID